MLPTIEAEIDAHGRLHSVELHGPLPKCRALLPLHALLANEEAPLTEAASQDDGWLKPEEDAAWAYLHQVS